MLGVSYATFRDVLGVDDSPIAASLERIPDTELSGTRYRQRWQIAAAEVERLGAYFGLPLREQPGPARKRPARTGPAELVLTPAIALCAAIAYGKEHPNQRRARLADRRTFVRMLVTERAGQVATDIRRETERGGPSAVTLLRYADSVNVWKARTETGQSARLDIACDPWTRLHVEAIAVRIGATARNLVSALVEQALEQALPPKPETVTITVPGRLAEASSVVTGLAAGEALVTLLEETIALSVTGI